MKRATHGIALTLGMMLALGGMFPVHGGMMGPGRMGQPGPGMESPAGPPEGMMGHGGMGMMGQGGMGMMGHGGMGMMGPQMRRGMMGGMPEAGMGMHRPGHMIQMLRAELELSDEQAQKARGVLSQVMKANIKQRADLRVAELELQELLEADPVDMGQVEAKLQNIERFRTALRLNMIKAHEQVKGMLTPEQRQKLERLHDRMPDMMGMMEMMEEGGAGGMGMMGQGGTGMMGPQMMPQMRRGMMGGMQGQSSSPMQMAGESRNVTQRDTQGAVTVEVTLITPDKPRADGKLAVQVKLDTHTVDLDRYQLEQLAMLRDAQGGELHALGLEAVSGDGHHRQAVLTFPAADADGKPLLRPEAKGLTLVLRDIGGVPERVFRWQLPLG